MNVSLDPELLIGLERVEILAKAEGHERAADALGTALRRIRGAWAFAFPRDPTPELNRVMGFGLDRRCASEDLAAFKAFYAEHGIPTFRISFFPIAGQGACQGMTTDEAILSTLSHAPEHVGDFVATLKAAGFGTYTHWIKWVRGSSPVTPPGTDLRIERARPEDGKAFDEVVFAAFGGYPHSVPISEVVFGRPNWHHYVARDGDRIVATAALYVHEGFAWVGTAGTLPSHRGRGAQGALLARRIEDALAMGCHTFTAETSPDPPGTTNPSSRNMERAGFRIAYRRPNWVFPDPKPA